jgi:cytochrome P450
MMVTHSERAALHPIPSIRDFPLLGSLPAMMRRDSLAFLLRLAQQGEVCGFHLGPIPLILFTKAEQVQSILVEHAADLSKGRLIHRAFGGNGLFVSEGEFHRRQRKLMAPVFQPRQIAAYAETMVRYGERLVQEWHDGAVVDLNQHMIALTMSIIGKVLFDADVFTETDELGAAMAMEFAYVLRKFSSLWVPPLNWPTPGNLRVRKATQVLQNRMQRMIDDRRRNTTSRNDLLSILLEARDENGSQMSDAQLMDECLTLFGAGHETTAAALTWAWCLLCQHPLVYQKVQQEVESVLEGRPPRYEDLARLPYCLQVFKETLRLYPLAASIVREALHDLEIDGYLVPKGSTVMVSPYILHHTAANFPDPETFDPERFAPEREKQLPRYAYFPFGAGPRICIGNHLALLEGHLLIATLVQRVHFTLVPGPAIAPDPRHNLTLRPGGKVEVVVKKSAREPARRSPVT